MKKFAQPGEMMTFTAPAGGVTVDVPVLIGGLLVIPAVTVAQGLQFQGATCGVFISMPKAAGSAWAEGQNLYWDDTAKNFTTAQSATARRAAWAAAPALSTDLAGSIKLNNIGAPVNVA
jgi:predicted RecA/RadA family phage recombinase